MAKKIAKKEKKQKRRIFTIKKVNFKEIGKSIIYLIVFCGLLFMKTNTVKPLGFWLITLWLSVLFGILFVRSMGKVAAYKEYTFYED